MKKSRRYIEVYAGEDQGSGEDEVELRKTTNKIFAIRTLGCFTLLMILTVSWPKIKQIRHLKGKLLNYFTSVWNWVDIVSLSMTYIITIMNLAESEIVSLQTYRLLAAIASCLLLVKVYDMLRLFETMSFYIELVRATTRDMAPFMILFFVAFLMFGVPIGLLSISKHDDDEPSSFNSSFENTFADGIMKHYMLSMTGEFNNPSILLANDTYEIWLVISIFYMATIFI